MLGSLVPAASDALVRYFLTRRGVLRLGLFVGGGAMALAGVGSAWVFSPRAPAPGRRALSNAEAATLVAVADAYFPVGGVFGVAAAEVDIAAAGDSYFAGLLPKERRLLRAVLTLWERWPHVRGKGVFSSLSLADRQEILQSFETSTLQPRRQLASLLRALVGMTFLEQPRALLALGHRPGCAGGVAL